MDFTRFVEAKVLLAECEMMSVRLDKDALFKVIRVDEEVYIALSTENLIPIKFKNRNEKTGVLDMLSESGTACFARGVNQKAAKNLCEFFSTPITHLQIKGITLSDDFIGKDKNNSAQALTEQFMIAAGGCTYMVLAKRDISVHSAKTALTFTFSGISGDKQTELHCKVERDENDSPYIAANKKTELRNRSNYTFILAETGGTVFTREREIMREKVVQRITGKETVFLNIWRNYCLEQYKNIVKVCVSGGLLEIEDDSYDGKALTTRDVGGYTFNNLINVLKKGGLSDCYLLHADENAEGQISELRELIRDTGELTEELTQKITGLLDDIKKKTNVSILVEESAQKGKIVLDPANRGETREPLHKAKYIVISGQRALRNLKIQEREFSRIMEGRNAMPHLSEILLGIDGENEVEYRGERRRKTQLTEIIKFFPFDPTLNQINALQVALETPDFAIILGPPGTGKSSLIKALIKGIEQYEKPQRGTLLTTYQHDALDSLITKAEVNGLPCLRYGGKNMDTSKLLSIDLAEEITKRATMLEEKYPQYKEAGILYRLKNSIAALDYMQHSFGNIEAYIEDILAYTREYLSIHSRRALMKIKTAAAARIYSQSDTTLAATVDKLRVNKAAFEDDGERNIALVEGRLLFASEADVMDLFEAYKTAARHGDYEAAHNKKLRLIASITAQKKPYLTSKEKEELRVVLLGAVNGIEDRLASNGDLEGEIISDYINTYKNNYGETLYAIKKYNKYVGVTHYQLDNKQISRHVASEEFENVIIDEAARSSPMDLFVVMSRASKRIILVGDHNQLPQFQDKKIYKQAIAAMKKKADESKIDDSDANEISDCSLFEKLIEVAARMKDKDGIDRFAMLTEQYRSPHILGSFVSERFYGNKLTNGLQDKVKYEHGIPKYHGRCAILKEIPLTTDSEALNEKRSRYRASEAKWIAQDVKEVLSTSNKGTSVGIMSFYKAQCDKLKEELAHPSVGVMSRNDDGSDYDITFEYAKNGSTIFIGTVDSYQGKEFDVVYLSVTVANDRGDIGFLESKNRRCVALSREKKLLIAVGSPEMVELIPDLKQFRELCLESAEGEVL